MDSKPLLIGAGAVAGILVLAVGGFVAAVFSQPAELSVERDIVIAAEAPAVHAAVADFAHFPSWSPWDYDPAMKVEMSDPSGGVGAWYSWDGNDEVGAGKMTLTSVEPTVVKEDLEFIRPFAGKAQVTYTLTPSGESTKLAWKMEQPMDFMGRTAMLFMDMPGMIAKDFDKGLGRIKSQVEDGSIGAPGQAAGGDSGAEAGGPDDTDAQDTDAHDTDSGDTD